jgi:hypothetical protein
MAETPTTGIHQLRVIGDDPEHRDRFVLMAYLGELQWQADFALRSLEDLLEAGTKASQPNDFDTWYAAQALLTALGIIRHLLLGEFVRGPQGSTATERQEAKDLGRRRGEGLRELLDCPLDTVLLSAEVRNAFEHIDERIDEATKEPYVIDTAIYHEPERMMYFREEAQLNEIHPLRQLSLSSGHLAFMSDALDLYAVRHDLRLLKKRIVRASQRPRNPVQAATGVFGHAVRWSRRDAEGNPITGDPFPQEPEVDD